MGTIYNIWMRGAGLSPSCFDVPTAQMRGGHDVWARYTYDQGMSSRLSHLVMRMERLLAEGYV